MALPFFASISGIYCVLCFENNIVDRKRSLTFLLINRTAVRQFPGLPVHLFVYRATKGKNDSPSISNLEPRRRQEVESRRLRGRTSMSARNSQNVHEKKIWMNYGLEDL